MKTVLELSALDVQRIVMAFIKTRPDYKDLKASAFVVDGCQPVTVEIDNEAKEKPGY